MTNQQNGTFSSYLENKIVEVLKNRPNGVTQQYLEESIPSLSVADLVQVLNKFLSQDKINLMRKGKQVVYVLKDENSTKPKMDPALYMEYNRIPNLFAKYFIKEIAETTDWSNANLDVVMDIGCGPGNISTYWVDHYFPNIKRLIGIDMDPGMIALAKEQNRKEKIEFHIADIMKKDSLKEWKGCVSRILSNFMLHRVKDQKQAFKNIFDLLEPSGEAALNFIIQGPYYFAFLDILKMPKWNPILEPTDYVFPEAFLKGYDTAQYKQMFEDVGFNVPYCETKTWGFSYESDEECKNLLYSLHSIGDLSEGLIEEFKNVLFDQYMKYGFRDKEGFAVHDLVMLHARLRKDVKIV